MPSRITRVPLMLCAWMMASFLRAMGPFPPGDIVGHADGDATFPHAITAADNGESPENFRLLASGLAVLLGPFGAHRLYLGTTPKVAIIYGITFGGFGVLALLDLGHILFTKDLEPYRNSDRVFMWARGQEEATPP